ncbi:MAG: haloacid dehalogenase [Flavobacteriales bacterium CG_4_9_14_3_um_filter_40_17]|nr:MAG: haloacid dehalogenase [Flavobacteriales bacterium CG_4_9_14_3_um_filter_40_17]
MKIKNIIFDFGDVFINLDKPATFREMQKFGLTELTTEMDAANKAYEKGEISTHDFICFYQSHFPNLTEHQLISAWNAIILDFPVHRLEFLKQLQKQSKHRIFLWSNTNALHLERVQEVMGQADYQVFLGCFEKYYFSHELGMRKPESICFTSILEEQNIHPKETLFIDDTAENTEAAHRLDLHVWNIKPEHEDVSRLFDFEIFR